ncbi:hypothetical protein K4K58_000499 [Colletotrichum sp. SAR11_239]|nr:hypothetical protein K4K58_000499 [Colletotrichum sp. SAR11_239]
MSPNTAVQVPLLLVVSAGEGAETILHTIAKDSGKSVKYADAGHGPGGGLHPQDDVEGHTIKNPQSLAYIITEKMFWRLLCIMTATLIVSGIQDLRGYLSLSVPFEGLMGLSEAAEAQELTAKYQTRRQEYRTAMESGIPVHLLNPKNFQAYGIKRNWNDVAKLAESPKLMGGNLPKNNDFFNLDNAGEINGDDSRARRQACD